MKHFLGCFCVRGIVAVLLLWSGPAAAQAFLENYAPAMPKIEMIPQKEFEASSVLYQDIPSGDKALSYKFRLPKDWEKPADSANSTYQVSDKVLGEIVRLYGPPLVDTRSYFSLMAINLDYALTAQQWLLQYLLSSGFTIQGIKEHNENRAEVLYVKVENGATFVIRTVAQINGKRIVLAQYVMPAENWDSEQKLQAQAMGTFELTHEVDEDPEEMESYVLFDIARFKYPKSWEFKLQPLKSVDRMGFELLNVISTFSLQNRTAKTLDGRIQVDVVSYDAIESVGSEIDQLKANLSKIGLVSGEKIETRTNFKFMPDVLHSDVEVFDGTDDKSNFLKYEYWLVSVEMGDYYYFVHMITLSRDEDYFSWARNTEAYKLILRHLEPLGEGTMMK